MRAVHILVLTFLSLVTAGCGSGAGAPAGEANLTVTIGDGPIEDLEEVWITVRELSLTMAGGKSHVVLDAPQHIELLGLRNLTEVLLMEKIVSGKVNKIRLLLDDLSIKRTGATEPETLPVPAGGWIDLNPQGGIDVRAGETIHMTIDVDLERSIQAVEGGGGALHFRPQVFVELHSEGDPSRLVRLKGIARGVNGTVPGWDLCDLRRVAGDGTSENLLDCVHIVDDDATVIENDGGLEDGVTVTAFGFMDFGAEEDTMLAEILVSGDVEPIQSVHGQAAAIADTDTLLSIDVDPASIDDPFVLTPQLPGAKQFSRDDPPQALALGDDVEAFGFGPASGPLDTFLVIYQAPAAP